MNSGVLAVPRRRVARLLAAASAVVVSAVALAGCSADTSVPIDVPSQVDGAFPDDVQGQLETAVTAALGSTGSTGAVVGVWAPWSGSWVAGLGTQGPGGPAVTDDLLFPVGLTTRSMTCDVMYALDAEGRLDASDPVSQWVSGIPNESGVTLGQLCQGTSGYASYGPRLFSTWLGNPDRVWNPRELASYGLGTARTGAPGSGWGNSDTGYTLLGLALERAGGASMAALYRQYVFDPLDLASATYPTRTPPDGSLAGFQSLTGADGVLQCATPADLTELSPSTGNSNSAVHADIEDLGRYAQALATGALPATPTGRFDDGLSMDPNNPPWLTTAGGAVRAGELVGQYGTVPGYAVAAFADPRSGLTVAIVLNESAGSPNLVAYLAWELAAIASKAAPASGQTTPDAGLPWTAPQFADALAANPVCPAAPAG